jgi:Kef-type K+ transport system membrane component KefB
VFFVTVGLRTNVHDIAAAPGFALGLTAVAVVTKLAGAGLGARLSGLTWRDSSTIGAGMIARGEVALVVATLGLSTGLMTATTFTVVIVMALATTLITPLFLKLTLRPPGSEDAPVLGPALVPIAVEIE